MAKRVEKLQIPKEVWVDFQDAFESFAKSRNFRLFDIKKLTAKGAHVYYRLRIRNDRALFHMDDEYVFVEELGPRGGVYKA